MAVSTAALESHLQELLQVERFADYCPNGLQVQGRPEIARLATGVTACQAVIDAALAWGADALLVHHGYFWKGEEQRITGMKKRRLASLLGADLNLFAYHLPLDAHPEFGNNAQLGKLLGFPAGEPLSGGQPSVGDVATLAEPSTVGALVACLQEITQREPLLIGDPAQAAARVAWCTGAAQSYIDQALAAGADTFITGEISEPTVHTAREEGIAFISAGHHATERYGVQALGAHLSQAFGLEHQFFDIDNPV